MSNLEKALLAIDKELNRQVPKEDITLEDVADELDEARFAGVNESVEVSFEWFSRWGDNTGTPRY